MANFFDALKAGIKGFQDGLAPKEYVVAGRTVRCPHCGKTKFAEGSALLTTAGRTFFGLDWTNPSATTLICAECGRIEWFANAPEFKD